MSALDVITIRDLARGDGVTNDAPAFNTAISAAQAAGGGTISADVGTYKLNSNITIPSTVTLIIQSGATFSGTGAVKTSGNGAILDMRSVSAPLFNVRAYGAAGDGATDDSGLIQQAINAASAAGGGTVFFPPGTYNLVATNLQLKSFVRLAGAGRSSIIKDGTGSTSIVVVSEADGCTIENLRFTGSGGFSVAGRGAIWAALTTTFGARKLLITGCFIDTVGTAGIVLSDSQECRVIGNDIRATQEHGIYVASSTDITIAANVLVNVGSGSSSSNVDGIKVANGTLHSSRVTITGNVIVTPKDEGVLTQLGDRVTIVGNTIQGAGQRSVRIVSGNSVVVSNNECLDSGSQGMRIEAGTGHIISGNLLDSTVDNNPIYAPGGTSCVIANNNIVSGSASGAAIVIGASSVNAKVSGNLTPAAALIGVQVLAGASGTRVTDNISLAATSVSDAGTNTLIIDPRSASTVFNNEVVTPASATALAGLNVPHGTAPTNPVNGDLWTTTAGMFVRINGVTKTVTLT